ncbi:MAG: methyltransferase [Candidatus Aminicenantes bacterium RBG_16_63_16]|nr:MAG: methyltransferase [Candidatus Aminicenantes bacterium RBG_16_63_16]
MKIENHDQTNSLERLSKLLDNRSKLPIAFSLGTMDGKSITLGGEEPEFKIIIKNKNGLRAIKSLNELKVAEAYINDDLDVEGDFIKAMSIRNALADRNTWIKVWRRLAPMIFGRVRLNPKWVAKHYDLNNIQLIIIDQKYNTYTQGIYESDDDSAEAGAERKLAMAFQSLRLKPDDSVLDIGCGWGGFLRFAAGRGAQVTGITLSRDQKQYVEDLIKENKLNAEVLYQDFLTFQPPKKYDGIVMMGVLEDLSDYQRVMRKLPGILKPGGRIYLDFTASKTSFSTSSFTTKYVWPGTFRPVYMPQFIDALRKSPFEIVALHNDRHNYYLWGKKGHDRWMEKKKEIILRSDERFWRMFRIILAGVAGNLSCPDYSLTAYRMLLELPKDIVLTEA